jgi:DNA-binding winged helix-turn-helix (wHTH) protein
MAETSPSRRYRFAEFTLSPARRSLRRGGREVPLIPRYLDLLLMLVERRDEALRRQEIFDRVWSDVVVSDGALTQAVRTLRRALGEDGSGGVFIRTVSRHGYQFVCPVVAEDDVDDGRAADGGPPSGGDDPATSDRRDGLLARLRDGSTPDEARQEAAEELHRLGTEEALRRLDRSPGHARAWAHLRDTRWEVAGAGPVPLLDASAGPAAWRELAALRLRRARRLVAARWVSASAGGALAGLTAGLLGGILMTLLPGAGVPPGSLLLGLGLVGALMGGLGAAGVGSGLAAAEALVRSWRTPALVALGAAGGGLVGAAARRFADAVVEALFAVPALDLAGGVEGAVIGAAAGLGYGLSTARANGGLAAPRGASRVWVSLATGLACAAAAAVLCAGGLRLGAASLQSVVRGFPHSQVHFEAFASLLGETAVGPRTRVALGAMEGLLFGVGLALGLTRRPRQRREGRLDGADPAWSEDEPPGPARSEDPR